MEKLNKLSTMIVDDHTLVSSLIATELARQGISATTVETVDQALVKLKSFKADIILLDVQLESPLLLSQVRDLLKRGSPAKVALFSNDVKEDFVRSCIDVGVSGIIPKKFPLSSLTSALRLMSTGQIFVPVTMHTKPTQRELDKKFSISVDDRRVLEKLAEGMSNSDIAASLNMSESTVKMRVRGLCKKLGAENRTQVLITAQRLTLV